jgi:hypothetical protein
MGGGGQDEGTFFFEFTKYLNKNIGSHMWYVVGLKIQFNYLSNSVTFIKKTQNIINIGQTLI